MKLLNEYLKAVKEKFPEEGARIEELYASDEDFRALCEDYFSCIQYLQKFKRSFVRNNIHLMNIKIFNQSLKKNCKGLFYPATRKFNASFQLLFLNRLILSNPENCCKITCLAQKKASYSVY